MSPGWPSCGSCSCIRKLAATGSASRLVATALDFATAAGYERMQLWTNHPLAAARHVYLAHGFELIREAPHHSFGVDLVGQTYELDLRARTAGNGSARAQPVDTR